MAEVIPASIKKLMKCVQIGIGNIYESIDSIAIAQPREKEMDQFTKLLRNSVNQMYAENGYKSNTTSDLILRAVNKFFYQELHKQQNIDCIISYTYRNLKTETNVSVLPVEHSWLIKFFSYAEMISDTVLQKAWAQIFAIEIKNPNSISISTLEYLKNIGKTEIDIFMKLSPFILTDGTSSFIYNDSIILDTYNINTEAFTYLEECGLIGSKPINHVIHVKRVRSGVISNKKIVGIIASLPGAAAGVDKTLNFSTYPILETGQLLLKIIENSTPSEDYAIDTMKQLRSKNKKFKVTAHIFDFVDDDGKINYVPFDILPLDLW